MPCLYVLDPPSWTNQILGDWRTPRRHARGRATSPFGIMSSITGAFSMPAGDAGLTYCLSNELVSIEFARHNVERSSPKSVFCKVQPARTLNISSRSCCVKVPAGCAFREVANKDRLLADRRTRRGVMPNYASTYFFKEGVECWDTYLDMARAERCLFLSRRTLTWQGPKPPIAWCTERSC